MLKRGFSVLIFVLLLFCVNFAHSQELNSTDVLYIFHENSSLSRGFSSPWHSSSKLDSAHLAYGKGIIEEPALSVAQPAIEELHTGELCQLIPYTTVHAENIVIDGIDWRRSLHIKTNMLGLGLAIANIAIEVDLSRHWSFTLPVYYSAWDYFNSRTKFRTLAFQPEFRYWPSASERNNGLFMGAHFGLAYYNIATNGKYRYQDYQRETPAIGGGVSIGYRLPISRSNRWHMEFSVGAGAYSLHYDKFHNTASVNDGLMITSNKKRYIGIDQAALSFSYMLNISRKGGGR